MSNSCDHPDDMRHEPGPDDRLAEDILRGRVSAVPDEYHSLAQVMSSIRDTADGSAPEPSAALRQVFAEGIRRDEQAEAAPLAVPAARPRSWRRVLGRAAGLGVAAKIGLAGATAAAMAAGAGATGSLPGQDGPPSFLPWQIEAPADESDPGREIADEASDGAGDEGSTVVERTDDRPGDGYHQPPGGVDEADPGTEERGQQGEDATEVDDDARELREEAGEPGPREAPADPPARDGTDEPRPDDTASSQSDAPEADGDGRDEPAGDAASETPQDAADSAGADHTPASGDEQRGAEESDTSRR